MDDWGLLKLTTEQWWDLLEDRQGIRSTLLTALLPVAISGTR
jgi:hypothetical protein